MRAVLCLALIVPAGFVRGDPANPPQMASSSKAQTLSGIARIRSKSAATGGCTAVLVTRAVALTAAHCAGGTGSVLVFHPNEEERHYRAEIARVMRHDDYEGGISLDTAYADLAILELSEDVPAEQAVPIPLGHPTGPASTFEIWGYTNPGNPPLLGHPVCQAALIGPGVLGSDCTVRSGMSGAPLLARAGEGYVVAGIAVATVPSAPRGIRALIAGLDPHFMREAGLAIRDLPSGSIAADGSDQPKDTSGGSLSELDAMPEVDAAQ